MPLRVIGAGQGRTGTKSLQFALEQLGFGPCYHGGDQVYLYRSSGWKLWLRALGGESVNWDGLFGCYAATVDSPGCLFYRELSAKYPFAKVILTIRNPDAWFDSVYSTFLSPQSVKRFRETLGADEFELFEKEHSNLYGPRLDRASVIAAYTGHNADVQRSISPGRLLVYDVTQGWEPLCRFLGVPVPAAAFPHDNSRAGVRNAADIRS